LFKMAPMFGHIARTLLVGFLVITAFAFVMTVSSTTMSIKWKNGTEPQPSQKPAAAVEKAHPRGTSAAGVAFVPHRLYVVSYVVDGDTLDVVDNGRAVRVRLLGINAPESVKPNTRAECFGREASQHLKDLVMGEWVSLEEDPSQGRFDKYGRHLAYVFKGGVHIDEQMIADGYAREYTEGKPHKYQSQFQVAEATAKAAGRGLWSACPL
jgi:endonuclease YncB( thermonuclease family)